MLPELSEDLIDAYPSPHFGWRILPAGCAGVMLLVLLVVDPWLAHAPWWTVPDAGLWFALALPILPWIAVLGLFGWLGFVLRSKWSMVFLSMGSIAMTFIPTLIWSLLLLDVFPRSGTLTISTTLSLGVWLLAIPAVIILLFQMAASRRAVARMM